MNWTEEFRVLQSVILCKLLCSLWMGHLCAVVGLYTVGGRDCR